MYPKHKQGEFTPKLVPVPKTYSMSVMINKIIFDTIADYVGKFKKAIHYCITDDSKPTLPSATPPH